MTVMSIVEKWWLNQQALQEYYSIFYPHLLLNTFSPYTPWQKRLIEEKWPSFLRSNQVWRNILLESTLKLCIKLFVQRSLNPIFHFWKSVTFFWIFNICSEPLKSETATPSINISKIIFESTELVFLVKWCTPSQSLISLLGAEISRHIQIWLDSDSEDNELTFKTTFGAFWYISRHQNSWFLYMF